jgi:hypothetical protein
MVFLTEDPMHSIETKRFIECTLHRLQSMVATIKKKYINYFPAFNNNSVLPKAHTTQSSINQLALHQASLLVANLLTTTTLTTMCDNDGDTQ